MRIGVDLMGSDNSPDVLRVALQNVLLPPDVELVLFGLSGGEFIGMEESPLVALRRKKKASLCEGLRQLRSGAIDAFVCAGNTGALVVGAKTILGMAPKILRPALLARMPTKGQPVAVLDVGANVQAKAIHLVQYALMGAAYAKAQGIDKPVVGLLNIGSEPIKGTSEIRLAYQELQAMTSAPFRFAGNIEGKSVFDGEVDVLVTEGFTGNVFLKTAEGIANLILDRFGKLEMQMGDTLRNLHYAEHPGALLVGVQGIVIKCHGYSTPQALVSGVLGAIDLVRARHKF